MFSSFRKSYLIVLTLAIPVMFSCNSVEVIERKILSDEMERSMHSEMLNKWYPRSVDIQHGGFLSTFTYDWKPVGNQDKMIVTQARHIWTNAKVAELYPDQQHYKNNARHGYEFLRDVMWDKTFGGFYTLADRQGNIKDESKTAYGNSFGIYALAAYYKVSGDKEVLDLAKDAFYWLEKSSHDSVFSGYYQHLSREGTPVVRHDTTPSTSDLGYKDQNSSIHLLEAFTELYQVWPDSILRTRLKEMLHLIRDTIVTDRGYMTLFFLPDWTPVSFRDSSKATILAHYYLDHVSFGHDMEIAYLMIEASRALGLKDDTTTVNVAKKIVDHSLRAGWDANVGGFYDAGYYFKNDNNLTLIKDTKNWWAQAEGLNTLLLMAYYFPDDPMNYFQKFNTQWRYIKEYVIDHQYGDWYAAGLDKEPKQKTALKGHIWKACYHQYRALSNCVQLLRKGPED